MRVEWIKVILVLMYINLVSMRTCTHSSFFACYHVPVTSKAQTLIFWPLRLCHQVLRENVTCPLSFEFYVLRMKVTGNGTDRQVIDQSATINVSS